MQQSTSQINIDEHFYLHVLAFLKTTELRQKNYSHLQFNTRIKQFFKNINRNFY